MEEFIYATQQMDEGIIARPPLPNKSAAKRFPNIDRDNSSLNSLLELIWELNLNDDDLRDSFEE